MFARSRMLSVSETNGPRTMADSFYDALAPYYHLIYPDWEKSIQRQSQALGEILREFGVRPGDRVLDAAAGIGTQALGLAAAGYDVAASDISDGAIERLEREAARRQLSLRARVADLRTLSATFAETFDAVLACDNAIPHLLTDAEIARAFAECRKCVRFGGVLIISVRDYATIERKSPDVRPYASHTEAGHRYSAEQVWEWDGDQYDVTLRLTDETPEGPLQRHEFHTRYYAVTISRLLDLLELAGFERVERRDGAFFQPLIIGIAA
jgi:SAM-dependent methyltransferase